MYSCIWLYILYIAIYIYNYCAATKDCPKQASVLGLDFAPTWSPRALTEINDWINDWRCFLQENNDWMSLV